ncbi:MAG TPA: O-acetylhomoserine aminocarboxypropyltransferase [Acidimicrobiia bacterium]|nr:O-acetylhomoserine aminocarboxypropyltransferase [Acidimicrobiia bacterium]
MTQPENPGFETRAVHAGVRPDPATGARVMPIYLTAGFVFEDTEHAASLFNLERPGHIYSRISNPTVAAFEERMASLEGGVGAVATASGQAALALAVMTLVGAGGHLVCSAAVYGGTANLLRVTLPRFGITTTFVPSNDLDGIKAAILPETGAVIAETIGNPGMNVIDQPRVAEIAHEAGVPLLIDNTFATPYLCRPFEHGADLIIHSATKFLAGNGSIIGGVLIDSGRFDWNSSGRFPGLTEPYAPYHDVIFTDEFGPAAFIARARAEGLRDFGACLAPETAFRLLQSIESLPARMDRHLANTDRIVEFLADAPEVERVLYPGRPDHPDFEVAKRLLPRGAGAVFAFTVRGGREAGARFIEGVRLFSHLANVGDSRSLVIHPASTTHQQLDAEGLAMAGVDPGMVRMSVGLESPDDLIADLRRGLRSSQG